MVQAYQFLKKHGVLIGFTAGGLLSVLSFAVIILGLDKNLTNKELYDVGVFDFGLWVNYLLFFISVAVAMIFPLIYLVQNFKESTKFLATLGAGILLSVVAYSVASGEITPDFAKSAAQMKMTNGNVKFTEAALFLGYWLFFAALASVVFAIVRPMFSKK